ncbi:MAG: RagB/SusD family nutrient uptake outer membrane protein [Balneolaceae bacterium]|nr:MAG: RagB/SusD family nutrient uptake outer membrane protein [Balneolaceae bacterium]
MNKLKILLLVIAGGLLFSTTACNDILENVEPATSVSGEVVLTSPEGVRALRSSMYAKMHESFAYRTEYFVAPSAFTDETRNRPGSTRYQNLGQAVGTSGTAHIATWGTHYNIIQDANLLIGAVEDGVLPAAELNRIRAEALAIRAFALHNLVKVYGYDPGNFGVGELEGNWDAGVVIRTEPVIDVLDADLRPRSSVNEVYAQILADLARARSLADNLGTNNSFITLAFIDGLTARGYLYAGEWANAAQFAQSAINNFGGTLQDTPGGVANMFDENIGNHPEALFKLIINPDTEGGGFNNDGPATYTSDGFLAQIPTQFLVDKYEEGDYRLGWYRDCREAQRVALNQPTGCADINDGGFSLVKFNGAKGQTVDDLPFMRLAEMYLILAEAQYKAGNQAAGIAALTALRDARNAGETPASFASVQAFEDFILDERMRELALEGHRFFDLKRLRRDIRNPDGSIKMFASSYRILPQIGVGLRNVNPQLVENPGY